MYLRITLCESRLSSVRQILYKKESGSLAKVVIVVAKTVPPTFNLTQDANEAKGGLPPFSALFEAPVEAIAVT